MMNSLIKLFPSYEDVFYDDIENHKKYFLPICSFNLKIADPNRDQWLHIVSVKEIYDGRVGEEKSAFYTEFTKADSFGFDVIDGKYRFDADWNFFSTSTVITSDQYSQKFSDLDIEYNMNDAMYQLKKAYYQKHNALYDKDGDRPGLTVDDIRRLERLRQLTVEDLENDPESDFFKERLEAKVFGIFEKLNTELKPMEDLNFAGDNIDQPMVNGQLMDFIASVDGYDWQLNAADYIHLFYDASVEKAVICLEYT